MGRLELTGIDKAGTWSGWSVTRQHSSFAPPAWWVKPGDVLPAVTVPNTSNSTGLDAMKIQNKVERGLEITTARDPKAKLVVLGIERPSENGSASFYLTPSQARRIASALIAEADRITKPK